MAVDLTISVEGVEQLRDRLMTLISSSRRKEMADDIGLSVCEKVKDHLDSMAPHRHKTADRLGAPHSRYLEYASGRLKGPNNQDTVVRDTTITGTNIVIENTPGLRRAYGPMTIKPKNGKKALTIPLHRIAYNKRVADLRERGHEIFRPGKAHILAEYDGTVESFTDKDGKVKKRKRIRPLYTLVRSTTIPQDKGLLPSRQDYEDWTSEAAEAYLATH